MNEKSEETQEDKNETKNFYVTEDDEPLWRTYLTSYLNKEKNLEREDKLDRRKPSVLKRLPDLESAQEIYPPFQCLPFNTFNLGARAQLPDRQNRAEKIRIWRNMKADPVIDMSSFDREIIRNIKRTDSEKWPQSSPCIEHNIAGDIEELEKLRIKKLRQLLPCEDLADDDDVKSRENNFANHKELGHARIPKVCTSISKIFVVDRATGEHPGLVDGDYITLELINGDEKHVYTQVCLRGMKGMHLIELSEMRARKKTYKFCFYQALVALLAKTQLRYKYATSMNIDYIYDHAWLLFLHMGSINIKPKQNFDDIVVYNYKYNIELELIEELKDVYLTDVNWKYLEKNLKTMRQLKRPELMKTVEELGWEKVKQQDAPPVHESTKNIEDWFDKLPDNYHNCIIRTNRFALAFWKDGNFWYLYNPFRCDRFGLWDDRGYACIMKFCSRNTLKRHFIILLIRAYAYKPSSVLKLTGKQEKTSDSNDNNIFTIQIFHVIYHCVKIHNLQLLQRKPPKRRLEKVWKELDDCNNNLLTSEQNPNISLMENREIDEFTQLEKTHWLKEFKITWSRIKKLNTIDDGEIVWEKPHKWHQYNVEELGKLFSLWSEFHPTAEIFARENRGKQMYACYIVCAGMTRIIAPEYWSSKTLDTIVMCGDRYYTLSLLQSETIASKNEYARINGSTYLASHFKIGEILFEVNVLPAVSGRLYTIENSLWKILQEIFHIYTFGILTCENACFGLFKYCGAYYMMNVNSIGPPIFNYGDGVCYLLRATSFAKFIQTIVLSIGSNECSDFIVNPVDILKIIDIGIAENPSDDVKNKRKKMKKFNGKMLNKVTCKSADN